MFSPLIVGELFYEQSKSWKRLALQHLKTVWEAACTFSELTTSHSTDEATSEALLQEKIDPLMEDRLKEMTSKLVELMTPYQEGHSITYNHYFTEKIQNMREKRLEAEVVKRLKIFAHQDITSLEELRSNRRIKTTSLISALSRRNEADMDRYASSEVLDSMQAVSTAYPPRLSDLS